MGAKLSSTVNAFRSHRILPLNYDTTNLSKDELPVGGEESFAEGSECFLDSFLRNNSAAVALKIIANSSSGRDYFTGFLCSRSIFPADERQTISDEVPHFEIVMNRIYTYLADGANADTFHGRTCQYPEIFETVCNLFPEFLASEFYITWRMEESIYIEKFYRYLVAHSSNGYSKNESLKNEDIFNTSSDNHISESSSTTLLSGNNSFLYDDTTPNKLDREDLPMNNLLNVINEVELDKILQKDICLFRFISFMENLPISFSLSNKPSNSNNSTIIYANKQYEVLTGYTQEEITGQDSVFLQSHEVMSNFWEPQVSQEIERALGQGTSHFTTVSHFRKNGELYRSFVYMKPIFNMNNDYCYMMTVEFDVTSNMNGNTEELKYNAFETAESLLENMPSQIRDSVMDNYSYII